MDDMQYVMTLSSRGGVGGKPVSELHEYLDQRYSPEFVGAILRLLVSCQSWVSRNWEEMQEVGLVANGGVVNAILIALFEKIATLDHSQWTKVAEIPLRDLLPRAQQHIDAQK